MSGTDWELAIAAVIDGKGIVRGTAFFVGSDVALTCHHVLSAAGEGPVELRQVSSSVTEKVIQLDRDEELDLALVRVPSKPNRKWLALSPGKAALGRKVYSKGFPWDHPAATYPDGFPMDPAEISGEITIVWRGQVVQELVLVGADVQQGMSGAPAVDVETNAVVGILRFSEKGEQRAFAIPAEAATRRWPKLPVETAEAGQPAPSFAHITPAIPEALAKSAWDRFDPRLLHCVVVGSERLSGGKAGTSLATVVEELLSGKNAKAVWEAFVNAWQGRQLLDGHRKLPREYKKANVREAAFDVGDAFASPASLDLVIRLLVEADLALFDVTGFEPGVMLLLGVRAATRRGITINSHGDGWQEGDPLERPFNLSDLSLSSHTPPPGTLVGPDPRINRLIERIRTGFEQLARQPHYLDLPVYDALRQLGAQESAQVSIPLEDEVLVLCSYDKDYFPTWQNLRGKLQHALWDKDIITTVARLQDLATPQLVSQSLYERTRRCAGCVADWTGSSPSTFFELGVRLAVSPWSVVQIVDEKWLQDMTAAADVSKHGRKQLERMQTLFDPLIYKGAEDNDIAARIAQQLVEMRERIAIAGSKGHRVRQIAAQALQRTQERLLDLYEQLKDEADALDHKGRVRDNVPQALFYEVKEVKADQERAALERRLAAWFYLEHRVGAAKLKDSNKLKRLWRELGEVVASDLFDSKHKTDQALAQSITERLT